MENERMKRQYDNSLYEDHIYLYLYVVFITFLAI